MSAVLDAEYEAARVAHAARMAALEAEHAAEHAALELRIARMHAALDALGAPTTQQLAAK